MNRRTKLITGLATAGVVSAGFGAAAMPAGADMRVLTVTLLGGAKITVTVDVPPGTPLSQIHIPGVDLPVVAVTDNGPAAPATSSSTSTPPAPTTTQATAASTASAPASTSTQATTPAETQSTPAASTETSAATADAPAAAAPAAPSAAAPAAAGSTPTTPATPATGTTGTAGTTATAPTGRPKASGQSAQGTSGNAPKPKTKEQEAAEDTDAKRAEEATKGRRVDGTADGGIPTPASPGYSLALPGAAAVGVPNFFIDKFRIPPFLLPIYQAAGIQYGVRWEVLAAINEIETDYGRNLNVSSAGALGWMQFMPATWQQYGVDANADGKRDPFNPADAIFAAARYLKAAGADTDVRKAVFAYNHADWYVDSVLMRARLIGGMPADLVGSLSGLTQGHFPVHATARYADQVDVKKAGKRVTGGNAANLVESNANRRGIDIFADAGAPAIAVQDGRIVKIGHSDRLGKFVMLRDVYGNTYTYAHLKTVADAYPSPKEQPASSERSLANTELERKDPKPTAAASAGTQRDATAAKVRTTRASRTSQAGAAATTTSSSTTTAGGGMDRKRLFAMPQRARSYAAGGQQQLLDADQTESTFKTYFTDVYGLKRSDVDLKPMKVGAKVIAGTVLGRLGVTQKGEAPHLRFEIRPAGEGAPRIDPKPILDGWKLLESTAVYRAQGSTPFFGSGGKDPSIGQTLLMSKEALVRTVLADPRVEMYPQGREDVRAGAIDKRVLATIEFLSASGLRPTVTMLRTGHSQLTSSGNVSEHVSGNAVDIGAINGVRISPATQGPGSITDVTIRRLLTLQGTMKPHQIISLMTFPGTDNTLSLPDHDDHIHVGFRPLYATGKKGEQLASALKPGQWIKLIDRLGAIQNPEVLTSPSKYALKVKEPDLRASAPSASSRRRGG